MKNGNTYKLIVLPGAELLCNGNSMRTLKYHPYHHKGIVSMIEN